MKVDQLTAFFVRQWLQSPDEFSMEENGFSPIEKKKRERQVSSFLKTLKNLNGEMSTHQLSEFVLRELRVLFKTVFNYRSDQLDLMFSPEMMQSTRQFVKKAKAFGSELSIASIFQACRNVWIMNGLQLVLGKPVQLTPAIFAYSMLYPYTDNFVDDPLVGRDEKLAFSQRFASRLVGEAVLPENEHERQIYRLVAMIEGQYDRSHFPGVYQALLGIHRAQTQSMTLLNNEQLSQEQALTICIEKGGTSVLADGFLIAGQLNEQQQQFLFGYGAYLQLLDDIQDVKEDLNDGLMTAFSIAARQQPMDAVIGKTFNFGAQILNDSRPVIQRVSLDFEGLLQKSILLFLIESVAIDNQYYSKHFQQRLEKLSPLSFRYIREKRNFFTPQKHVMFDKLEALTKARKKQLA
ncbi:MAG TPA: hypothetical protein VKA27_00170 [Sunxiuqinia sp.]|nr:hypothetical protein [Sunxiuqinia sp.]